MCKIFVIVSPRIYILGYNLYLKLSQKDQFQKKKKSFNIILSVFDLRSEIWNASLRESLRFSHDKITYFTALKYIVAFVLPHSFCRNYYLLSLIDNTKSVLIYSWASYCIEYKYIFHSQDSCNSWRKFVKFSRIFNLEYNILMYFFGMFLYLRDHFQGYKWHP